MRGVGALRAPGGRWTVGGVFGHAWRTLMADFLAISATICAAGLVYFVLGSGPSLAWSLLDPQHAQTLRGRIDLLLLGLAGSWLVGPLLMGLYAYAAARLTQRPAPLGLLASQLGKWRPYMTQTLVLTLVVAPANLAMPAGDNVTGLADALAMLVWTSLAIAYMSTAHLVVSFGTLELVLSEDASGLQALERALRSVRRRPFAMLGAGWLLGFILSFSVMCCLLPGIVGVPFGMLAFTALYMAARE